MVLFSKTNRSAKWNREVLGFVVVCLSSLTLFAILYFWLRDSAAIDPFLAFNARLASVVLNLFGGSTQVDEAVISSGDVSFRVITECTSIVPTAILVSAIIGWPSLLREKLTGVVLGSAVLFLVNVVRIITLFYIGSASPWFLDIAHSFLWGALLVVLVVAIWLLWTKRLVRTPR